MLFGHLQPNCSDDRNQAPPPARSANRTRLPAASTGCAGSGIRGCGCAPLPRRSPGSAAAARLRSSPRAACARPPGRIARRSPRARRRRGSVSDSWWCVMAGGGAVPRPLCFRQTRVFRIGASGRSKCPLGGRKPGLFGVARSGDKFRRFHDGWGGYLSFVPVECDAVGQRELPSTTSLETRRLMFRRHRIWAARRRSRLSRACTGVWASAGARPQDVSDA